VNIKTICANCEIGFTGPDLDAGNVITVEDKRGRSHNIHVNCPKGRHYPEMPPRYVDETMDQYTDRLCGADKTGRVPYDHKRYRQCSIGWHDECSAARNGDIGPGGCECPHHTDPDYLTLDEQERRDYINEAARIIKMAILNGRIPEDIDAIAAGAAEIIVDMMGDEDE
jgi:hypothetical protein